MRVKTNICHHHKQMYCQYMTIPNTVTASVGSSGTMSRSKVSNPLRLASSVSWPRIPQDDFGTHDKPPGTSTSTATLVITPTMLILYVAGGPKPGMVICWLYV